MLDPPSARDVAAARPRRRARPFALERRPIIRQTIDWLRRVVTRPQDELTRWQRAARFAYEVGRRGAEQLRADDAPQMAGALAFRTLFGLLPVLVVGSLLARAVYGPESFEQAIGAVVEWIFQESGGSEDSVAGWVKTLVTQAQQVNLAALGSVGFVLLTYSAVSLMVTIENAFNRVYRARSGRSWLRRVPVYWTVLTLGPVMIGLVFYVNTELQGLVETIPDWHGLLGAGRMLWSFLILWMLLLAVYRLLPAADVAMRPALVGSFVASACLGGGQQFLGAYLSGTQSIRLLGSLGFIPLFMFWIYVMWLAVLFGLEVAASLQHVQNGSAGAAGDGPASASAAGDGAATGIDV